VTTQVCDQCGHVDPHATGAVVAIPFQPKGTTTRVLLDTQKCGHTACFCNFYIPRDLLPSEPAL
jgi:hypothetical protein